MRNVTNYEVVIKRREKKEEKEREGQKGRMNKRARVDERVEVTRDKSGCSKSARIFSNFVAPSAAAERAAFPPFHSSFFRPPPPPIFAHVSRPTFSSSCNERYSG